MKKAKISKFESMAMFDGDGVRSAVFFAGCPMRCIYCHNPETWAGNDFEEFTTVELFEKIKKLKPYYGDIGGVTFSGGEPLLHTDFLAEIVPMLKKETINFAIDTSGGVELNDKIEPLLKNSQLVILDLKFSNSEEYIKYAKGDFDKVLSFGNFLAKNNIRTWVRTVIVPNINDNFESIEKYCDIVKQWCNVEKYELLGFHTMGFEKYKNLGLKNHLAKTKSMEKSKLETLQKFANSKL